MADHWFKRNISVKINAEENQDSSLSLTASSPFYRPLDIKAPHFNFLNIFLPSKCFPDSSVGKESACNAGDRSSAPG